MLLLHAVPTATEGQGELLIASITSLSATSLCNLPVVPLLQQSQQLPLMFGPNCSSSAKAFIYPGNIPAVLV